MAVESAVEVQREKFAAALKFIEDVTTNSDEVQKKVLAEILSLNAEIEYLKRHELNGATDRETFKSKVPVVNYEDIQPDICRIANGDFSPILCAQPISEFLTSSGTSSGERKLFPSTVEEMNKKMFLACVFTPVLNLYISDLDKGKVLGFQFIKPEIKTPGGLVAHPVTSSFLKSSQYKNRPYDPYNIQTSPIEAILCTDAFQSMYAQLICGLYDRLEVTRIGAIFPTVLLRAVQFFQLHHHDLCHDISTGTLNTRITDHALRALLTNTIMRPDPDLATFIYRTCQEEKWEEGFIRRIWPNAKYLNVVVTGSMAQYIPTLDYYSGGLPKLSFAYASSECFFGLNLKPLSSPSEIFYTLFPNMAYFEFIPLDGPTHFARDSMPRLVDLVDVEVGKEYEIVVTTYAGLYRYRIGDVLRVTGFYNSAPQFKFVRRNNVLLSIDTEKTDELDLQKAIENASKLLQPFNTSIMEYTGYANIKVIPGHYVIYLELLIKDSMNGPGLEVLDQCCLEMEEALNSVYRRCRVVDQSIGPLEIRVVKSGTFEELMDHAISRGGSISQYKVPRCLDVVSMVELLDSRVVSAHFSPSMPHWSQECHV